MASDNVTVNPGENENAISVATDEIDGVHYPVYKMSYGGLGVQTPVSSSNPLPIIVDSSAPVSVQSSDVLTHETDTVTVLNEISRKLSILIEYEAMLHKINLEES
jgi:hypothetical protein